MDYLLIIGGLLLLFIGGEALIRGSVAISKRLGISAILIGVVVVGFGTSTPELLVSVKASLAGQPGIALGNVVGSNIANILLILALAAIITPIICKDKAIKRDSIAVVMASVALLGLTYFEIVTQFFGVLMFGSLCAYLFYSYKAERKDKLLTSAKNGNETVHESEASQFDNQMGLGLSILMSIGGIAMLVFGADFLVDGASNIARTFGVSEAIIGLSLVAVGTSLPELAAAISAALKKNSDVIIGNILGSNLFNILAILGIASIIKPMPVTGQIATFDIPFAFAIAVMTMTIILWRKQIGRFAGVFFIITYATYIGLMYTGNLG